MHDILQSMQTVHFDKWSLKQNENILTQQLQH